MAWAAVIGAGATLIGGSMASRSAKKAAEQQNAANAEAAKPDPRVDAMLWGQGGSGAGGLMDRFKGYLDTPQSAAMQQAGQQAGDYLATNGARDMNAMRDASMGLLGNLNAPQAYAAQQTAVPFSQNSQAGVMWNRGETFDTPNAMQGATAQAANPIAGATVGQPAAMQGAMSQAASVNAPRDMQTALAGASQVNAPAQNGMDLTGSYDSLVNGEAGNNPYMMGRIQAGINQSSNAFGAMQRDSTQNLLESVMPSIRGGAVIAGGYGGSRQGIAEGRALDSFAKEQQRAIGQFGQHNTDAAVTAQAGAYNDDRNRQLSATQGLGAQQYGVASQNSAQAQAANMANAAARNNTNQANYQGGLAASMANAGYQQQSNLANQASNNNAAQTNYQGGLSAAMANAGYAQQAGMANQSNQQQANMANAGFNQQANATNYAGQLQANQQNASNLQQANLANQNHGNATSLANAQLSQNTNQFNSNLQQQMNLANLGNQQQSNMANLQAQLGTNQLNTSRLQSGMAGLSGLLGTAYQNAGNQDNYQLNRAQQVNSLLAPYLTQNRPNQPAPVYANSAGAGMGGALMGMQLGQGLMGMFNGGGSGGAGAGFTGPSAGNGILSGFPAGGY